MQSPLWIRVALDVPLAGPFDYRCASPVRVGERVIVPFGRRQLVGVVLSMHTRSSMARFGAEALIPAGLAIVLIRETGPAGFLRVSAGTPSEMATLRAALDDLNPTIEGNTP